jgi:hypothetical protein
VYALLTAIAISFLLPAAGRTLSAPSWGLAGLFFGLAYLARPEGLLMARWRGRLRW